MLWYILVTFNVQLSSCVITTRSIVKSIRFMINMHDYNWLRPKKSVCHTHPYIFLFLVMKFIGFISIYFATDGVLLDGHIDM